MELSLLAGELIKAMRTKIGVAALFAVLFFPILSSSVKRAAEASGALRSPALIPPGNYNVEPEKLGALVFDHSDGMLSDCEVWEIAKGFARLKKEKEE
jgi:hypothetical protein